MVGFAQASGTGTVSGTGNATASAGVATKTVTGVLAGSVTMEATAAGLTTGTLGAFSVVHGAASQIALTGSTADLTSGATRVLTATIEDAAGNTVTSDSTTVIAFAKQSGIGTVSGTGNATATAGVATKTITGALAGPVTIEATAAGLRPARSVLQRVHSAAANIVLTGSSADLDLRRHARADSNDHDAAGNTVTSDNTTVIGFAKTSGTGTVSGTGNATASSGVATKTITGALTGTVTMEATVAGLDDRHPRLVHRRPRRGDPDRTHRLDGRPGLRRHPCADGDDSGRRRQHRHLRQHHRVAFAKASGAGTVSGAGNATAVRRCRDQDGHRRLAGTVTIEATAAGLTAGTLGAFTVVHGPAPTSCSPGPPRT